MRPKITLADLLSTMKIGFPAIGSTFSVQSPDRQIGVEDIREQQKTYLANHYLVLHITVVGVSLAMAGVAAANIATHSSLPGNRLLVLSLLWVGSLAAIAVAYSGPMVGAFALRASIPAVTDLLLPLLLCIAEFVLFSILILKVASNADLNTLINTWLVAMAAFAAIAALSIRRAQYLFTTALEADVYDDKASDVIYNYLLRLYRDLLGASTTCVIAIFGSALRILQVTDWPDFVFPLAISVSLFFGLACHAETSQMWRQFLMNAYQTRNDSAKDQATMAKVEEQPDQRMDQRVQH